MNWFVRSKSRLVHSFHPVRTRDQQNAWHLYADIAWFGVLSGIAGSFLSVYLLRSGGSDFHVGLLSALPALVTFLVSIPGSLLVEHAKHPLSVLIVTALLNRGGYLVLASLPISLVDQRANAAVALIGLMSIPASIANIAFTNLFAQVVEPTQRSRVLSMRSIWVGITSTATSFIGGKLLDHILFPINYQILFILGFIASLVSVYHLTQICLPIDALPSPKPTSVSAYNWREWVDLFRASRPYARVTLSAFFFHWGMFFALPLYSIYWVRVLHATEGWVGLLSTVGSPVTIVCYPMWSWMTMRCGNGWGVFLAALGLSIYPLATLLSPGIEWIVLVQTLGGITTSG